MKVGLLVITHDALGSDLLKTAASMMGDAPMQVETLRVHQNEDPDTVFRRAKECASRLDRGDGVLVLTDAYGATPANIANRLAQPQHINVVAGINLPMLIRIFNYADLNLSQLTEKALTGGRDGVVAFGSHER